MLVQPDADNMNKNGNTAFIFLVFIIGWGLFLLLKLIVSKKFINS